MKESNKDKRKAKKPKNIRNHNNAEQKNMNSISGDKQQPSFNGLYEDSKDNTNQNNSLQNDIDNFVFFNLNNSSIENKTDGNISSSFKNTIKGLIKIIIDKKIPYPNEDEIPLLKIKDENILEYKKKTIQIDNYLKDLAEFDDTKFNKCTICKKNVNNYFCENCYKNICDICYENCLSNKHKLIDLKKKQEIICNLIKEILLILSDHFKLCEQKRDNDGLEKKQNNSEMIDENEINSELVTLDYINDILLIQKIIDKNYINYFHFQNIVECRNYIGQKYKFEEKSIIQNKKELKLYNIELEENYDEYITIIYKISNNDKIIKIFGKTFVENNNNIGLKIDVDKKIYELTEFFELKNLEQINQLEIKLIGINKIVNACCMFSECSSLISLPDIYKWNTTNLINISGMFESCSSLISLPDISKWNTSNINDMSYLFNKCSFLLSLPDVSEWDTRNVNNMSYMFNKCSFLLSLPDISKWDTSKVNDMSYMFSECSSLISLPKISKWNTSNVINISRIFDSCCSLKLLPDISKWNIKNVTDISGFFCSCSSLISIPDISKWNTSNVTDISSIFCECFSLISLPDVSEWNTSNVNDMHYIFSECSSLISLPNISKWNTSNVNDMSYMFNECSSLISLPDISKWNTSKVNVMNYMFVFVLH